MAQCRLVSHAFDRLSIPILVRSVTLKRSGEKAITFCRFMLEGSGRAFLLSIRQLLVYPAACVFSRTAFPPWTDVPSFLSLRHSLLDVITAAKELTLLRFVASSDALLEPHDPESHPECTPHRHLSYMELETMSKPIHPTFLLVQHLSLSLFSFSPSLEREIRVLTVFPALRSFSGPTSAFVSLSFHHQLEFVRLREHRFDCGRPAWIGSDNEVDDVLRAISRVPARSIAIGINILDDEGLASSFWGQLAGVAPLLEDLAVTMSYHDYMVSTSIADRTSSLEALNSLTNLHHVWLHVFERPLPRIKWYRIPPAWVEPRAQPLAQSERLTHCTVGEVWLTWQRCVRVARWDSFTLRLDQSTASYTMGRKRERGLWVESPMLMAQARDGIMFVRVEETGSKTD
ncbi:uncharacterized protein STEHIDRAFT_116258 [Stereum hirsutum FP-91666 SS1]|uniref:Uncharacterized protein n=1 Tax=Stereum hirsutum (strain FP-91666) TaxID=721885 RepID=R7RY03_STEHR|nr:uncharacterized protein STEHIDRAFT_116258 [Stereum hirsutum FP-91666 SS1]EIM79775.1 hypothetical protein STEHIDRAFT_116258 [Stereum hirsutum FP-91666 SS1]